MSSIKDLSKRYVGADVKNLAPIVVKWEAGYVNDPIDKGGATNMGITLGTWKHLGYDKNGDGKIDKNDIKLLTEKDFEIVLKKYWDKWKADEIINQSIANILVDWYWGSGKWGIVIPQRDILGFTGADADGIVGNKTLNKLNEMIKGDAKGTFDKIFKAREKFLRGIVSSSVKQYEKEIGRVSTPLERKKFTQERFINGWLNRLNDFKFSK